MEKITANIIKRVVGKLPLRKRPANARIVGWYNEKILKHQEEQNEKIIALSGLKINYRRPYELLHTYRDIFTREIYRFQAESRSPFIIDCGANIGLSVLYFKSTFPAARILAFEPDTINFQLLGKNVIANKLTGITVKQSAVWTTNGTITFASEASEGSHIAIDGSGNQIVNSIRLADILVAEERVDFLKIDIEGAEWPVIQDCEAALKNVHNLFLEYHGRTEDTFKLAGIYSILNKAGFSVYIQNAVDSLQQPFFHKKANSLYDVQLNIFCFRQ